MEKRKEKKENNGGNSGHYVVASQTPNGDRLQRTNIFTQIQEQSVVGHVAGVHHLLVAPQPHQLAGGH